MNWKKNIVIAAGCTCLLSSLLFNSVIFTPSVYAAPAAEKAAAPDVSKLKFRQTTDKNPISYKTGEEIVFRISLDYGQELPEPVPFFVQWIRSGDDGITKCGMTPVAPGKDAIIKTSLDRAGFVRLQGVLTDLTGRKFSYIRNGGNRENLSFDISAGCNVDEILPAIAEPDDFDKFWEGIHAELAKVPVKAVVEQISDHRLPKAVQGGKFLVQQVTVDCAGPRPVTGYLIQPLPVRNKSLPVQVTFDGYGQGSRNRLPEFWQYGIARNKILFRVNAHGYDLGKDDKYYNDFFKNLRSYAFDLKENERPETSYFYGMAMRVIRAFDFVKTLPAWNGKDLIAQGGSQGGLQTLWAGSQVKGLTLCNPHITWCSDIGGQSIGRLGGWMPAYRPGLAYYDTVFHARRIPQNCYLDINRIGLGDYVCPPSGLAALYNAANCPKQATWIQGSSHIAVPADPEEIRVSHPAGKGLLDGVAEKVVNALPAVDFVNAAFDADAWTLTLPDGKVIRNYAFAGRENIRKKWNLKVHDKVYLHGVLMAEDDGFALVGVGADWWWHFRTCNDASRWNFLPGSREKEFRNVFGRSRSMPGGNIKNSFTADDWLFRVPVKKGKNSIQLEVILGDGGFVAMDVFTGKSAGQETDQTVWQQYGEFTEMYPDPLSAEDTDLSRNRFRKNVFTFKTAQAFPAALEYCIEGENNWIAVWDSSFSKNHKVQLPVQQLKGKKVQLRIAQHIFLGSWFVSRSKVIKTVDF